MCFVCRYEEGQAMVEEVTQLREDLAAVRLELYPPNAPPSRGDGLVGGAV